MKYFIVGPGRTGSYRIFDLLSQHFFTQDIEQTSYSLTTPDGLGQINLGNRGVGNLLPPLEETKSFDEIREFLGSCKDNTVIHSHAILAPPDLENWTIIYSTRKSKAELIMSRLIARHIGNWKPVDKDIKFTPFEAKRDDAQLLQILNFEYNVKKTFPNHVEIRMEDDCQQIMEKLKITFDKHLIDSQDTRYISNHRYPDLITNYLDVFKWCGEEHA